MHKSLLEILRCPFCGTELSLVEGGAPVLDGDEIVEGVLGCECCAFPLLAGIPILIADDSTRHALHLLEAGQRQEALLHLLQITDPARQRSFLSLVQSPNPTFQHALELLSDDAEGTWCLHRFADPVFMTIEALVGALGQERWPFQGRVLDLCGGFGHITRVLQSQQSAGDSSAGGTVLADLSFWKLWLATRFAAPGASAICCDANNPLPFAPNTFSFVLLADAFPYIWHKRMLADEMMRLVGHEGLVVMPHLHSALGENFSAGDTLTPAAYRALFAPLQPRLFSDQRLQDDVIEGRLVDLTKYVSPAEIGSEAALTLIASPRSGLFRRYEVPTEREVRGTLAVNPLYVAERTGSSTTLRLRFPTPEYEAEFAACRRYLPESITLEADLTPPITEESLGAGYGYLREHRVLIDAPIGYVS